MRAAVSGDGLRPGPHRLAQDARESGRVLITGASSGLVPPLARRLRAAGMDVVVSSRTLGLRADLSDLRQIDRLLQDVRPTAVVHLGALVGRACEDDPRAAEVINVEATGRIAHLARELGVERLVLASTAAVYPESTDPHSEDETVGVPATVYGRTKLAAEQVVREFLDGSSVEHVTARLFNVWGSAYPGALPVRLRARGDKVQLRGLDEFVRDYVHVDDVAEVLGDLLRPDGPNQTPTLLNVATGVPVSNRDLLRGQDLIEGVDYEIRSPLVSRSVADVTTLKRWWGRVPGTLPTTQLEAP